MYGIIFQFKDAEERGWEPKWNFFMATYSTLEDAQKEASGAHWDECFTKVVEITEV